MSSKPKYTAAIDFRVAGEQYTAGDPIENPVALDAVLRFGDRFVKTNTKRATKGASSPAHADPANADPEKEQ